MRILIDARTRLENVPLGLQLMCGKLVLCHWVEFALTFKPRKISVVGLESSPELDEALLPFKSTTEIELINESNAENFDLVLGENKIYRISQNDHVADVKDYVLWELKSIDDLVNAEVELIKSGWFPIGRFYLEPFARKISVSLKPTPVSANQVTYASILMGLLAAYCVLIGGSALKLAALFYLLFWLLDIADGKLARLKRSVSKFGGWLDSVSGEFMDYLIHGAIIFSVYSVSNEPYVLWIGILYFIGKHLFIFAMQTGSESFKERGSENSFLKTVKEDSLMRRIIQVSHFLHDSDVRIHILALSFVFNCAWWPLVFYMIYYNVWFFSKIAIEYSRFRKKDCT